jgi:hypothetical protein
MKFEVPKRHISRLTDVVQWVLRWEKQKRYPKEKDRGSMAKK